MNNYELWIEYIDGTLKPDKSFDIIKRELEIGERRAVLYFIDGFIKDEVYEKILEFLYKQTPEDIGKITDMTQFARLKMPYVEVDSTEDKQAAVTAVLSGPSHAEEVARGIPTSVVVASASAVTAQIVQSIMSGDNLRIYTSDDLIGVELGGALKNVIAIASGFCDGLGLGDNTKAALITRGLAEMARLGVCMGAKEYTFSGLAGIGDLVVTCTSQHSRNHRFGEKVGSGTPVNQALSEVGTVEGYYAAELAYSLAKKYKMEMPITEECYAILYENKDVKDVLNDLMRRPKRSEH